MALGDYREAVKAWTDTLLEPYLTRIASIEAGTLGAKEFNDPLWGTVTLQPAEVVVLDSPLLQRLRRIRQLGVVHLVYASANHSRLEHSIGVCHQVGRIAESIRRHAVPARADATMDDEEVRLLRMTGLCHDIGHGCLSHVVENALKNDRSTRTLLQQFNAEFGLDTSPHLSEMAAHFMLKSDSFRALLEEAHRINGLPFDRHMPERMSSIVIGQIVSDEFPLLHELISGPFDADKLDYMPRDAMMTGVPVVTDIGRLIQKVRAVRLSSEDLPDTLSMQVRPSEVGHLVVGLAQSGGSTLDEVAIGRSLMFDKVYRHHKVRAAEAMVTAIVDSLGETLSADLSLLPLRLYDEDLLHLDAARLASLTNLTPEQIADLGEEGRVGMDIADRLSRREMFVRAFAFSQHLPEDPYRGEETHRKALDSLMRDAAKADTRRALVQTIAEHVRKMIERLEVTDLPSLITDNVERYVWVDPPSSGHPDEKPDPSRAYVIGTDGRPREVRHVSAEQRGWVDAYTNTHDMGYVFTIAELSRYVAIATRIAVFEMHDLRVPDTWALHTKLSREDVESLEQALLTTDFYEAVPPTLRPHSEKLRLVAGGRRIAEAAARLSAVQSPTADPAELKSSGMTPDRVRDWVKQFGPQHEEAALSLAENIKVLGRNETNTALSNFLSSEAGQAFAGADIVPIGQPKDGSAVVGYHAVDVAEDFGCRVVDVSQALAEGRPIVFVDDFIGRGSSTITIFEAMLGEDPSEQLGEARPDPLTPALMEHLRDLTVSFVYTAGLDGGAGKLRDRMLELGLSESLTVHVDIPQRDLPYLEGVLSGEEGAAFVERARDIGRQLLPTTDPEKLEQRALGYGNHGLLLAFPYNTPTATLTALWARGRVDTWTWHPLLARRPKK